MSDGTRDRSPPTGSSSATGFRPDHSIAAELRLDLDPILGSTRALAPLIDPNEHSCGTVPPHGVDELAHPEPGFYAVGVKSYGRAPTFLLATGYEQARSVVAALAGDWDAARDVQLDLPETGVCTSNPAVDSDTVDAATAAAAAPAATAPAGRGLATGIAGGLLPPADPGRASQPAAGRAGRRLLRLSRCRRTDAVAADPRSAAAGRSDGWRIVAALRGHPDRRVRRALLRLRRPARTRSPPTCTPPPTAVTGALTASCSPAPPRPSRSGGGWTATAAGP